MKTLGEFIVEKQAEYPNAKGELSGILSSIRLVAKVIHRDINKAGLTNNIIGNSGVQNVQGEAQMKLDLFAHNTMKQALMSREEVAGFASEEEENFIAFDTERGRNAKYVILTDPLDGSSNIDVNVAVGTIFSIYRRISPVGTPVTLEDFMQPGNRQVAAGYIVYGSSTMLVYTTGNGVNGFAAFPQFERRFGKIVAVVRSERVRKICKRLRADKGGSRRFENPKHVRRRISLQFE